MKNLFFLLPGLFYSLYCLSQDKDSSYFTIITIGKELGDFSNDQNELYFQNLHGYKFNSQFGLAAGPAFIYYDDLGLLPLIVSVRKSPDSEHKWGFNFDMGYSLPLFGKAEDPVVQMDYKLTKGGSYFNPEANVLLYNGKNTLLYMNFGYRVYAFEEEYVENFRLTEVKEKTVRRVLNFGISIEL